jgi:hypothetical protein
MPLVSRLVPEYAPNTAATEQQITIPAAAASLRSLLSGGAFHKDTNLVILALETAGMRICPTGGTPSASLGVAYSAGQIIELSRKEADVANVIRSAAGATAQVLQYL